MKITGQLGVFLLAMFLCAGFVTVLCLIFWLDAACLNDQRRIFIKAAGGVGCFEFWLNRYQALIGSALAASVAGATLIALARQLAASNQQTAIASSVALRKVVEEFTDHINELENIRKLAGAELGNPFRARIDDWEGIQWHWQWARQARPRLHTVGRRFSAVAKKNRSPGVLKASENAVRHISALAAAITEFHQLVGAEDSDRDLKFELAIQKIRIVRNEVRALEEELDKAIARIRDEIDAAWSRIRELEFSAIGPWWRRDRT